MGFFPSGANQRGAEQRGRTVSVKVACAREESSFPWTEKERGQVEAAKDAAFKCLYAPCVRARTGRYCGLFLAGNSRPLLYLNDHTDIYFFLLYFKDSC